MELRILGPLEVVDGSRSLPLGGTKQRALLAVLVLNANRLVSTDRLIDALWGASAPEGAAHTLQVYVSQLRKAFRTAGARDDLLVTQGRGYVLRVETGEVDLHRFQAAIEEGRRALADGAPDRASLLLRDALDLWRGAPLEGLEFETFAPAYIARIEDERLSAIEDRVEADLALGRHTELVGELRALLSEFPLRERLRAQLMLALYRSGRQAEALATYREARDMLADELGIDPAVELQRLERAILTQAPELDLAPVATTPQIAEPAPPPRTRRARVLLAAGAGLLAIVATAIVAVLATDGSPAPRSEVPPNSVARIDPSTEVVAAVPTTGTAPTAIVWADGSLWVANTISRTVARIDPETNSVVQTVPSGGAPTDLTVGNGIVWVLNGLDGTVLAIDPRTNDVAGPATEVPDGAGGIAADAGGVWVTNGLEATVIRIDPETRRVAGTIRLDPIGRPSPRAIAVEDDGLWVGDGQSPVLYRIDVGSGEVTATVGLRAVPTEIAVVGDGTVWATSYDADLVSVVDPSTLQATTIMVGHGPMGLVVDEPWVWVANSRDGTVSRIDARSERLVGTVRTGPIPEGVAVGGGSVWVSVHA